MEAKGYTSGKFNKDVNLVNNKIEKKHSKLHEWGNVSFLDPQFIYYNLDTYFLTCSISTTTLIACESDIV